MRCGFVEEITSFVLLYINFPWTIVYKSFESWLFYLNLPLNPMNRYFYVNMFQLLQI